MTNDRLSGLALIAGSAGVIITLSLHPSGRGLFAPETFQAEARKLIAVHSLALACLPLWFLGACGLSQRLGSGGDSDSRFGFAGLVLYGFAMAAMMTAVVFDGLITPGLAGRINEATGTVGQGWRITFNYNGMVDQAFVRVFVAASSVAILLWSVSIVRSAALARAIGIYGCVLGAATVIALLSGQLDRYVHLFGMALVGQALWFVIAGVLLSRLHSDPEAALPRQR
ncbi:MAG: hypothetical protein LAN83_16550 [Acidobacteriia bacterium]|nr:hypothetical protein [Terriglobia bacterium]